MTADLRSCLEFMSVKEIVDENFQDYKKASMFICAKSCDFKCLTELNKNINICQNMRVSKLPTFDIKISDIFDRYVSNIITRAVIIGGLEPMLQFHEVYSLIYYFRKNNCPDDFVIYTGYYYREIEQYIKKLQDLDNIIIKYGRYIPDSNPRFDNTLGIILSFDNQYSERIC